MSPSHYLIPYVKIFLGKNTYLDAGWSLFEGTIIARRQFGFMGVNAIKSYLIDFFACIFAKLIFVESEVQKKFYCKLFLVRHKKCFVLYTGVDEDQFKVNIDFDTPIDKFNNSKIVLFRGKYAVEAGLEVLARTTKLLSKEKITFWVFAPGIPKNLEFSENTILVHEFIDSKQKLAKLYSKAKLTLGQLSDHPRLDRTIPHKAFESAFLSKPYLTSRTKGILELFTENEEIICFKAGDSNDLAKSIGAFFCQPDRYEGIGNRMHKEYIQTLSQSELAKKFLNLIKCPL
jgi:glycosyltransferase involved in cell wall biosynthesis